MSLIHRLTVGHIDEGAARRCQLVVIRPLSRDELTGHVDEETISKCLDPRGVLVLPWLSLRERNHGSEELALLLQRELGCVMADVRNGAVISEAELRARERDD
ncbi:MAG: hypothetical protein AAF533_15940 [Acidobacteriota bacterium]